MTLRELIAIEKAYLAPAVFNPLCAKIAQAAGFEMLYLGGGTLGYVKCGLEANLDITVMTQAGIEIRAVSDLPLILDGAAGFGDPMHMHHVIPLAEAAGFAAIEIEDQILPKRAHHHIGIEHMVPMELMVAKVREAVRARRSREFLIIARTNGVRSSNMDDALRRAEAYRAAGADAIYITPRTPEEMRFIGERLGPPLMYSLPGESYRELGVSLDEMAKLGFRILTVTTPQLAFHRAMQETYAAIRDGVPNPAMGGASRKAEQAALHHTLGFDALIEIEKRTVEKQEKQWQTKSNPSDA
jgi:2-methylisocitrate lyase-like PEP mutase family enzyme